MKRSMVLLAALVGMVLSWALPAHADMDKDNLVFWYALKSPYKEAYAELAKTYEASHPHVALVMRSFDDPQQLRDALSSAGSGGPDVVLIDATWQDDLIASGKIVPVQDQMEKAGQMVPIVFKADIFPPLYRTGLKDGKVWTIPTFATDDALIYNTQMFADKKLKKTPKNWSEVVRFARRLTDESNGIWGFELPNGSLTEDLGDFFTMMLWQTGSDVLTMDSPVTTAPPAPTPTPTPAPLKAVTNKERGAKPTVKPTPPEEVIPDPTMGTEGTPGERMVGYMVDMVQKYKVAPIVSTDDLTKVAMFIGTPETLLSLESKGVPVMAAPMPTGRVKVSNMTVYSFAITATAKDPEAAYQFANWLGEFEQSLAWTTNTPFLPANKQVTLSPGYFEYLTKHPGLRIFLAQLNVGRLKPATPRYAKMLTQVSDGIKDAIVKKLPGGDAIKGMMDNARRVMSAPHS